MQWSWKSTADRCICPSIQCSHLAWTLMVNSDLVLYPIYGRANATPFGLNPFLRSRDLKHSLFILFRFGLTMYGLAKAGFLTTSELDFVTKFVAFHFRSFELLFSFIYSVYFASYSTFLCSQQKRLKLEPQWLHVLSKCWDY